MHNLNLRIRQGKNNKSVAIVKIEWYTVAKLLSLVLMQPKYLARNRNKKWKRTVSTSSGVN